MPVGRTASLPFSAGLPRGRASLIEKIPRQLLLRDAHMQVPTAPCERRHGTRGLELGERSVTYLKIFAVLPQGCLEPDRYLLHITNRQLPHSRGHRHINLRLYCQNSKPRAEELRIRHNGRASICKHQDPPGKMGHGACIEANSTCDNPTNTSHRTRVSPMPLTPFSPFRVSAG